MNSEKSSPFSEYQIEQEMKNIQLDLRGYVISLTGPMGEVEEIMQQTNITVWQKRADFQAGTSFKSWVFSIAHFKMLGLRRDALRRGHVAFSEETIEHISHAAEAKFAEENQQLLFLRQCIKQLKKKEQMLIQEFYTKGHSLTAYAKRVGKSVAAVHKSISRVRLKLRECINQKQGLDK